MNYIEKPINQIRYVEAIPNSSSLVLCKMLKKVRDKNKLKNHNTTQIINIIGPKDI